MKQYAERDILTLDELGNHYSNHVQAMTAEKLHDKTDIAAELAWRDAEIDRLKQECDQLRDRLNEKYTPPPGVIGYMQKDQLSAFIENGSQHDLVGLDSPDCWAEEAPYQNLVAVCAIESIAQHDAEVIERAAGELFSGAHQLQKTAHKRLCDYANQLRQRAKEVQNRESQGGAVVTTHCLKTDPEVFQLTWDGKKPWEIRYNDRDYQVGDTLVLKETRVSGEEIAMDGRPATYTGRQVISTVTAIVSGYGLEEGWVVMTAMPIEKVVKEVKS